MLKPIGSKAAQIYGLAKVHKENVPLRLIVSISGTTYDKLGRWISKWLEHISESKAKSTKVQKMSKRI